MKIPKATESAATFLRSVLPEDERIKTRPMFGNLAAFVNGSLFTGLFGEDLFVRLSQNDAEMLLQIKGTEPFAPMKGRVMKGYVVFPKSWKSNRTLIKPWVEKSLNYASMLPAKSKKLQS